MKRNDCVQTDGRPKVNTTAGHRRCSRLADRLRAAWSLSTVSLITLALAPFGMPTVFLSKFKLCPYAVPYLIAKAWIRLILLANGVRVRTRGFEHLDRRGSYVFISNHRSLLDPPIVILMLPHVLRFTAKRSVAYIPIVGWGIWLAGVIMLSRGNDSKAIGKINRVARAMKGGISFYFFAEGTRGAGELLPLRKGAFRLALDMGLPLVPVTITGSDRLLPKGKFGIRRGTITVTVDRPIPTAGRGPEALDALREEVTGIIRGRMEEPSA